MYLGEGHRAAHEKLRMCPRRHLRRLSRAEPSHELQKTIGIPEWIVRGCPDAPEMKKTSKYL